MGESKGKTAVDIITKIIIPILCLIAGFFFGIWFEKAKEPKPEYEVEIIANSTKINDKYEIQASIIIENLGLTGEQNFKFEIILNPLCEIVNFASDDLIIPSEKGEKRNRQTFSATLRGKSKIEGILTFKSNIRYVKGEKAVPIKIRLN